ncbi:MAG: antibiotic biosynthesis monooxygenase [Candidatus Limnocylindrales bacterium]
MYGTVARVRIKPGTAEQWTALQAEYDDTHIDGFIASYVYRLDVDPDDHYLVVMFRDEASYRANASAPDQDARYRKMRDLLAEDPKWHDGEIIWTSAQATE